MATLEIKKNISNDIEKVAIWYIATGWLKENHGVVLLLLLYSLMK